MEIMLGVRLPEKAFYGSRARSLMQLSLEEVKVSILKELSLEGEQSCCSWACKVSLLR